MRPPLPLTKLAGMFWLASGLAGLKSLRRENGNISSGVRISVSQRRERCFQFVLGKCCTCCLGVSQAGVTLGQCRVLEGHLVPAGVLAVLGPRTVPAHSYRK